MKRFIYIIIISALAFFCACDDINPIQQDFLDRGEQVYLGKPISVKVGQGYEKILVKWESNPSPLIKKTVVYWNNQTDSVVKENITSSGFVIDSILVSNLREGSIEFTVVNKGEDGLYSLPEKKMALVLGENYTTTLIPRGCSYVMNDEKNELTIIWDNANRLSIYSIVTYTSIKGIKKEVKCLSSEMMTILSDIDKIKGFSFVTYYRPDEYAIEDFPSRERMIEID